jgi:photosystem II stability/assembly factor-like uncharacterized protein
MRCHLANGVLALAAAGLLVSLPGCGGQQHYSGHASAAARLRHSAASSPGALTPATTSGSELRVGHAQAASYLVDLSWLSSQRGWALAAAPCSSGLCPRVAATRNGGRSWQALSAPSGLTANWQTEISHIRFATDKIGYLFGPALYLTRDGGHSWRRVRSRPVEALEPAAGTVLRVVYNHAGCPGPCTRTLQEAVAGSGAWQTLLRIPIARANDGITAQILRPAKRVIYVPVYANLAMGVRGARSVILRSTDGGRRWQRLLDPCDGTGTNTHAAAATSAGPQGYLAVLCDSPSGTGRAFIRTSDDYGLNWGPPRTVPSGMQLLATPGRGRLVLATGGVGGSGPFTYRLDVSADDGLRWTDVVTGTTQVHAEAALPPALAFAGSRYGWWAGTSHDVWITRDGGQVWLRRSFTCVCA